jgi:sugar lactone lactonase YvrE
MLGVCALALFLLAFSSTAHAGPFHPRVHSLDITALNHACGAAVDSKGDLYASSAGNSKIKVYDASHTLLTEIEDANTPCGLAVTTTGDLYVSEKATGEVVRFKPNKYPFEGTPTYGSREVIDASTKAKGIAVDPIDNRLYVAEGDHVAIYKADGGFEANVGEGTLTEASGVAPYTYSSVGKTRYLWVADPGGLAADKLALFTNLEGKGLALRRELKGTNTPDGSFGFGAAGAYLAADPGNRNSENKCVAVSEQACSAGHLFLYDAAHKALDEFDATGEYLDRTANASFADAEPTAIAIDRSGGSGDGTLYVTAGAGAGAKALAFGPLKAPSRKTLEEPLSHILANARAVATDSHGDVYAAAAGEGLIHVYGPDGKEIVEFEDEANPSDIAVDSVGNVYVFDDKEGFINEAEVTYYEPSSYPPEAGTEYARLEPSIVLVETDFPAKNILKGIAVNPGPGPSKDRLYVASNATTHLYKSAAEGSEPIDEEFAKCVPSINHQSIAVNGANGTVYIGTNASGIYAVDETGKECLGRFDSKGSPSGKTASNPYIGVDQANGHVIEYDGSTSTLHEYDAAGSFVAEFGSFTENIVRLYRVAVDSSCALHNPPLDETTVPTCKAFDPANGNVYVAWDDSNIKHPPYDVNAFGPLDYGSTPPTPEYELTVKKTGDGSGEVKSSPAGIECDPKCSAKFEEDTEVTLTAKADPENEFIGWTGCEAETVSKAEGTCKVAVSEKKEVEAEFKSEGTEKFPLEVVIEGPGSGKVTSSPAGIECPAACSAEFFKGVKVTLTAKEDEGSKFASWTGCDANPSPTKCEVSISGPREVKVKFKVETPLLTVVKEGAGSGTVTGGSVAEPSTINCGSGCEHEFTLGAEVTLKAKEEGGSSFREWGGACSGKEPTCEVTMSKAKKVTATFDALPQAMAKPALVGYDEATLRGEVDPSGLATEYRFEYLSEEEYEANGESFEGAQATPVGELAPTKKGFVAVEAPIIGLEEGTEYRFRLLAMNAVGPAEDEGSFETLQRPAPQSCPNAAYRFGLSANLPDCRAYELITPAQTDGLAPYAASDGATASGSFSNWLTVQHGEAAGERLSYFTDGTLPGFEGNGILDGYRAERGAGEHPAGGWQSALFSPDYAESATGFAGRPHQLGVASDQLYSSWDVNPEPGASAQALDRGVYLRTPGGFEALGQGSLGTDLEALSRYVSASGAHVIFSSKAHLEPGAPPEGNAALYDRAAGSASAHVLTLPPDNASEEEEAEFLAALRSKEQARFSGASEDGATVVFKAGVGLYVRLDDTSTEKLSPSIAKVGDPLACAAGPLHEGPEDLGRRHFQWLRDATPIPGQSGDDLNNLTDYATTPADEGAALQCLTVATEADPRSVAVSAPVVIAPLGAGQAPRPPAQIAPPSPPSPAAGTLETCNAGSWEGAESLAYQWYADGQAIASATSQTYEVQAADVPGTLQCIVSGTNAAATVAKASGLQPTSPAPAKAAPIATAQAAVKATYAGVSEDGRYTFFALGDGESSARLFRFDTQSESATEIAGAGIFVAVSPDGSHAFFSSAEALGGGEENDNGEEAEEGERNLYAWDGTETSFIGRLSVEDFKQNAFAGIAEMNLATWTRALSLTIGSQYGRALAPTRSTPGGGAFVFQSHARLTAYDNEGVGEIYRYEPAAAAGERLLCVSCDPSGAPPSADALLEDIRGEIGIPLLRPTTMIASLTDGGEEVFFQSFDRLLPEDANEVEDVYEWRAEGSGSPECTRPGGCLALISSGQGEVPSTLYAMSADGRDVFLQTKEKLVGTDVAGSPSIYDAREGGGIPEPAPPAPCQGDSCQGQGSESPAIPGPATGGAGENGESPPSRCAKGKHRVKGRCVAVKHHKHRKRHRRAHANRGGKR